MTTAELYDFLILYGFCGECAGSLAQDYEKLQKEEECLLLLDTYRTKYVRKEAFSYSEGEDVFADAAQKTGVHRYAAKMLFYLNLAPQLRCFYAEKGLSDDLFEGVMADLYCKAKECMEVYGVWGSFVSIWFARFFNFSLYALGRLEFCLLPCPFEYKNGEFEIKKGQLCIDVHIPSRGRLTRAILDDAYRRAAEFFEPQIGKMPVVFHCESWLLADFHNEMLPPASGIRLFARDYTLLKKAPDEGDLWRIFGHEDTAFPEKLSEDTLLKRAYKRRLCQGLPVYGGEGLFFYENDKKTHGKISVAR